MTIEDVELIIKYVENDDIESLFSISNKEYTYETLEDMFLQIMRQIENDKALLDYLKKEACKHENVQELISYVEKKENVKYFIDNKTKYELSNSDIVKMIKNTSDTSFAKECIENRNIYGLFNDEVKDIIISTKDIDFMKECVKNRMKYRLATFDLSDIIQATQDLEFMKHCVHNRRKYELLDSDVIEIIESTKDTEFIEECIENRKDYVISRYTLIELIALTKDRDYIKQCIKNLDKYDLYKDDICEIIKKTKDEEFIKECALNKDKYHIANVDVLYMINNIKDEKFKKEFLHKNFEIPKNKKKLNIPKEMTVGIEIETEGNKSYKLQKLSNIIDKGWIVKLDNSLDFGLEVVSPILKNDEKSINSIYKVCAILKENGQEATPLCGGHIHIGADYLSSLDSYKKLLELWANNEKLLYIICNQTGTNLRKNIIDYAPPISKKINEVIKIEGNDLEKEDNSEGLKKFVRKIQRSRNSGINFLNIWTSYKKTIEIRIPNGTINSDTWIENINLFGGIIAAAEKIALIEKKGINQRSKKENKIMNNYEKILDENVKEKEKLNALLNLAVGKDNKKVYIERYNINKKLMGKDSYVIKRIKKGISKDKIILSKKDIGRVAFIGENQIFGEEYIRTKEIIESQLQKEESKSERKD